jgi:hypothetical protein
MDDSFLNTLRADRVHLRGLRDDLESIRSSASRLARRNGFQDDEALKAALEDLFDGDGEDAADRKWEVWVDHGNGNGFARASTEQHDTPEDAAQAGEAARYLRLGTEGDDNRDRWRIHVVPAGGHPERDGVPHHQFLQREDESAAARRPTQSRSWRSTVRKSEPDEPQPIRVLPNGIKQFSGEAVWLWAGGDLGRYADFFKRHSCQCDEGGVCHCSH